MLIWSPLSWSLGSGTEVDPLAAVSALHARGHRRLLHEGGAHVIGSFLEAGAVDELFLTVSPKLVGQQERSFGLVRGVDFGRTFKAGRLLSVRRADSYLFLRYALENAA